LAPPCGNIEVAADTVVKRNAGLESRYGEDAMSKWDSSLIEKIHYVLELMQNAEDENSSSIIFSFNDDYVAVMNDGRPFDEEDVWGICSVRPGRKKNKIGFFGIGFKSVFNITREPQIISNGFNFEIENYIYPQPKRSIPEDLKRYHSARRGAIFVLPYSSGLSTPQELIESFNCLDDRILLFLENVQTLEFIDNMSGEAWSIEKDLQENSTISLLDTRNEEETKWRVFHRNIQVDDETIVPEGKEDIKQTRITLAFPVDGAVRDAIKETGVVYCYLPTKRRADLPFLIQADFLPTIGRENISDHPWNVWLMKELGGLAADAIEQMRDDQQLCDFLYGFVPLSEEIRDDLVRQLYVPLFESLKEKEMAKTTRGWLGPQDCAIPDDDRLRNILTETDLALLQHKSVFYIDPNLSEEKACTRAERVLFELGSTEIGADQVIEFLQEDKEIAKKSKHWFLDLYDYLSTSFDPSDMDEHDELLFEKLQKASFILTHDRGLVPLEDPEFPDRLICYFQRIDLSRVRELFTKGEIVFLHRYFQESGIARRKEDDAGTESKRKRVKEWFDRIGVKKHFKQSHIIREVILPKFTSGRFREYSDVHLYWLVDYIRDHWSTIESEIKSKKLSSAVIEEIRRDLMVKTYTNKNGSTIEEYRSPNEVYFSKRYGKSGIMEDLFEEVEGIHFLSPYYLNRERTERRKRKRKRQGRQRRPATWRRFFEILGVWSCPRVEREDKWRSISGKERYSWIKKQWSPRGIHEVYGDSHSDDLERLIACCSKMDESMDVRKRMILLWESLEKHWKLYGEEYCRTRYQWFHRTERHRNYHSSSFLEFLRDARWVPGEDGGFYKPSEVFTDTNENRLLLGDDARYVSLKASGAFLRDLGVGIEPNTEEVTGHLKAYKQKNPNPEESQIEKMGVTYGFLRDKIDGIQDLEYRNSVIQEIREVFDGCELLYLPRRDKAWWKPRHVFWKDFSDKAERLRGYVEHNGFPIYDASLKDFFLSFGVAERPLLKECFDILEDLRAKGDLDHCKRLAPKIYTYIDEVTKQDVGEGVDWDKAVFLSKTGQFSCPSELYYNDNEEYEDYFGAEVDVLHLPFSWNNIRNMLQAGGFRSLSQNTSVVKKFGDLNEVEGDTVSQLIQRLSCIEHYLKKNDVELCQGLRNEGVFERIQELRVYQTPKIVLDYSLKPDDREPVRISDVEKEAYFSNDENRLYVSSPAGLFSTPVAKELSKLFAPGGHAVLAVLDSLFGAEGEEELGEKLRHLGIEITDRFMEEPSDEIRLIPSEEEPEPEKLETECKAREEPPGKPQLPISETLVGRFDLIDPDEFVFDTIEERTPYTSTDGVPSAPTRTVTLKKGYPGAGEVEGRPRRVNRVDAEAIALEMVMRFEEIEGRQPEDRHAQRAIGYDVYSEGQGKEERFIEVKHFRGEAGTWELTAHQWKKAEQVEDRYFVYVVSRLRKGNDPLIEIIQNPVKYLTPEPPAQKSFRNWKNGVKRVIECQKV